MADDMKVKVGADVGGFSSGMDKVERDSGKAGKSLDDLKKDAKAAGDALDKIKNPANNASAGLAKAAIAANKADSSLQKTGKGADQASMALINIGRVAQDAPFGFLGIANNLNPLLESFQRLTSVTGSAGGALKALGSSILGAGGIGLALSLFQFFALGGADAIAKFFKSAKEVEKLEAAKKAVQDYKDAIKGIYSDAAQEATQVASLIVVLKSETETRQRKLQALKDIKEINPEIFNGLKLEHGAVVGLDGAYQEYIKSLKTVITAKSIQVRLEQAIAKQLELQGTIPTKGASAIIKAYKDINKAQRETISKAGGQSYLNQIDQFQTGLQSSLANLVAGNQREIDKLMKDLGEVSKGVEIKIDKEKTRKNTKETIDDVIADLYKKLSALEAIEINFKTSKTKEKVSAYLSTIEKLITDFKPSKGLLDDLFGEVGTLKVKSFLATVQEKIKEAPPIEIPFEFAPKLSGEKALIPNGLTSAISTQMLSDLDNAAKIAFLKSQGITKGIQDGLQVGVEGLRFPQLDQLYADAVSRLKNLSENLKENIKGVFMDSFIAVGDAVGQAILGGGIGDVFGALFGTILESLGSAIRQFGVQALLATKIIMAIKATLGTAPGIGIALGAIALGSVIKALGAKLKTPPKFADGVTGFRGGVAMVGERGPELVRLPSGADVVPNHSLGSAAIGGGMSVDVNGNFRVAGTDLVLVLERANKSLNRQG